MTSCRIALIEGDGIGPEIVKAAMEVVEAACRATGVSVSWDPVRAGAEEYVATGRSISSESIERIKSADATLKGPVGDPAVRLDDGTEAGLLGGILRPALDAFANIRPIKLFPGVRAPLRAPPGEIDYVIVRENTEGLYASRGRGVGNSRAFADTLLLTREGCERIVRHAFELARRRAVAREKGDPRVTCVDKSNVLRSFAFFRAIFDEVAASFPDVAADHMYSDAAAQALVIEPWRFDVLVMENFLGDLLSDLGGGTVGGIGLCPSANVGLGPGYFEPVHGSAPSIAGKDRANPIAQILAAGMLMDSIGQTDTASRIQSAVWRSLELGLVSVSDDGSVPVGTEKAGQTIASLV